MQEFNFCNSKEEAIYYYSILADYLRKKVVENPPSQIELRKVSKKEISEHLEKGRKIVFTSSFKEYKGEQFYFKFLKDQFVKPHKNQDIFIIVGNIIETPNLKIESLILKIILKHYEKATYDIKPLNFIISDSKIVEVKKNLLREKCPYNDGYETIEFNEKLFFSPPIINRKISGKKVSDTLSKTSFQSRILTKTNFDQLTEINGNPMWIILEEEKHILIQNTSYQIIKNLNTDQILKLF
ncbi:hypothetical protein [Halpernia sp. GG3]